MTTYEVGIIGAGGMGSAAAYHLAQAGVEVVAFDRYQVPHSFGSSHSESRLIRQAYFENPDYVPLLRRAYTLWEELEDSPGQLLTKNGLFIAGHPERRVMQGVLTSAKQHGIKIETMSGKDATQRFQGFHFADHDLCIFEESAGYLLVEKCIEVHRNKAIKRGAVFKENQTILTCKRQANGFLLTTSEGSYQVRKLVLAAGAWTGTTSALAALLPPAFQSKLTPHRVPLFWFPSREGVPVPKVCFAFDLAEGFFYGFPKLSNDGVKMGLHKPGPKIIDPTDFDRVVKDEERTPVQEFVAKKLSYVSPEIAKEATCMYTMTPDEDFIVQEFDGLVVLAGFSGHGFKFASVIGEVAKDLVICGKSPLPVDFLRYRWP